MVKFKDIDSLRPDQASGALDTAPSKSGPGIIEDCFGVE